MHFFIQVPRIGWYRFERLVCAGNYKRGQPGSLTTEFDGRARTACYTRATFVWVLLFAPAGEIADGNRLYLATSMATRGRWRL